MTFVLTWTQEKCLEILKENRGKWIGTYYFWKIIWINPIGHAVQVIDEALLTLHLNNKSIKRRQLKRGDDQFIPEYQEFEYCYSP